MKGRVICASDYALGLVFHSLFFLFPGLSEVALK